MTNDTGAPAGADPVGQAIAALTAAARQTRLRGKGTPAETVEPADFAAIAAQVLTAVAANVGSGATLLAGRYRSCPPASDDCRRFGRWRRTSLAGKAGVTRTLRRETRCRGPRSPRR